MPTTQLPLSKGLGKDYRNADYVDLLPVNMLATPKEVLNASGYLRSYPGIQKQYDVAGVSRGADFNTAQNTVYRVLGGKLYKTNSQVGDVSGSGRVSMACSYTSQAVAASGAMTLYRYDGTVKTLTNWPEQIITQEGYTRTVKEWSHVTGNTDFISFVAADLDGSITLTITPKTASGVLGAPFIIAEVQWGLQLSQAKPATDTPYITALIVKGSKAKGSKITIEYTFNPNLPTGATDADKVDISLFKAVQVVPEVAVDYAQYDIGVVRDICRARGRYVWVKDGTDTFGITDLSDESHPDQYSPFYRAESQPDGIQAVDVWRDFVVCFGTSTIEYFSLTGATSVGAALYVAQPSLMVSKGIAGTYCKTAFADTFAFISHQATGAPSIYVISQGQVSGIATASIEKILRSYSALELSSAIMETTRFDSHELLIIHLPNHVLCYDAAAAQNGAQWAILKTGLGDDVYRGIDFMYEGNQITVADKGQSVTGYLKFDISSQYDAQQEHLLYTPMFKANNGRVFDFELEASTGVSQFAERLFISATSDGINYGREQMVPWNAPFRYDQRAIWTRVGRVRKNIGFKVRIITSSPVTLSDCSVRVE